jgi:hypothetical protein
MRPREGLRKKERLRNNIQKGALMYNAEMGNVVGRIGRITVILKETHETFSAHKPLAEAKPNPRTRRGNPGCRAKVAELQGSSPGTDPTKPGTRLDVEKQPC